MPETTTRIVSAVEFFLLGVALTVSLAWHFGVFDTSAALKRLQQHNDSVTVEVRTTVRRADSLAASAASAKAEADHLRRTSDSLSSIIQDLRSRRAVVHEQVSRLPDTGVARRFQELIR